MRRLLLLLLFFEIASLVAALECSSSSSSISVAWESCAALPGESIHAWTHNNGAWACSAASSSNGECAGFQEAPGSQTLLHRRHRLGRRSKKRMNDLGQAEKHQGKAHFLRKESDAKARKEAAAKEEAEAKAEKEAAAKEETDARAKVVADSKKAADAKARKEAAAKEEAEAKARKEAAAKEEAEAKAEKEAAAEEEADAVAKTAEKKEKPEHQGQSGGPMYPQACANGFKAYSLESTDKSYTDGAATLRVNRWQCRCAGTACAYKSTSDSGDLGKTYSNVMKYWRAEVAVKDAATLTSVNRLKTIQKIEEIYAKHAEDRTKAIEGEQQSRESRGKTWKGEKKVALGENQKFFRGITKSTHPCGKPTATKADCDNTWHVEEGCHIVNEQEMEELFK